MQTKEEFEQEVIDLFLNTKMSLRSIAQKYNRKSYDFIYNILQKRNIDVKRRHISNKIDLKDIHHIIDLYQNYHFSISKISKEYSVSGETIRKILIENCVEMRRHFKQTFDEYYFDNINTHNKAYLLGFLYADGCVNKNNVISFCIQEKDKEILEMYIKELHATNPITQVKGKQQVRISFCSKHMCDTLINMGCMHNKTYNLSFPNIPYKYQYDFIRGFMDGDGCISITNKNNKKYINLSFTGTNEMMASLKTLFEVDNQVTFYRNAYTLHIGKTSDVMRILNAIYSNAELYMTRKFNKYQEYLAYINKGDVI